MGRVGVATALALIAATFTAGCNPKPQADRPATTNEEEAEASQALAAAAKDVAVNGRAEPNARKPGEPLLKYLGQLPADGFLADPLVEKAVAAAVPDAKLREFVFDSLGPEPPIVMKNGRVLAWGCEIHNCGLHEWSVDIEPNGSNAEVCIYKTETSDVGRSRIYSHSRATERAGECPSS